MTQTVHDDNTVLETIREAVDSATAGKVFGRPIIQGDMVLLPVATVKGQGGSGPPTDGHDAGDGLRATAKPAGLFVIKDGKVGWRPAVDINRIVLGGQLVAVTALLVLRAIVKARGRRGSRK
jgi:uncharacterized spore protein YtfJ